MDLQDVVGPPSSLQPSIGFKLQFHTNALLETTKSRFTDKTVKIITAMSIFNPSLLPSEDSLPSDSNEQIQVLADYYGKEAEVQ